MFKKITGSFILALHNIRSNFFHTILSITGIVIGVASLVSILSLIDGMERFAQDEITKTTSLKAIMITTSASKNVNGVWIRKDTVTYLTSGKFIELKNSITHPASGVLWQIQGKELWIEGDSNKTAANTTAVSTFDSTFHLVSGHMISESDFDGRSSKAVVSEQLGKILAGKNDVSTIVGRNIIFGDRKLELVGIVKSSRVQRPELFFPITLLSADECKLNPPQAMIEALHVTDVAKIKDEVEKWVRKNYGDKNDFNISTNEYRVTQAARGFKLFRIIMGLIVGISVLVGGIGVMNVLLISVTERTAEIGVRKAVGANRRDIVLQFLSESITISLFGSLLGLVLGILGTMVIVPIVKSMTGVPFQAAYTLNTLLVISILSIVVGIVFGTYPAMRAARLDPVEAIRRE